MERSLQYAIFLSEKVLFIVWTMIAAYDKSIVQNVENAVGHTSKYDRRKNLVVCHYP